MVCDCDTRSALVCKEHPDCRPSYCKMRLLGQWVGNIRDTSVWTGDRWHQIVPRLAVWGDIFY